MIALLKTRNLYFVIYIFFVLLILINNNLKADQEFKIIADQLSVDQINNTINSKGNVVVIGEKLKSKADEIIYDKDKKLIKATGNVLIKD